MTKRMRVGLIFGGSSVEHEVSVVSARGIARALDPARIESIPIGVTGEGAWLSPEASSHILEGNADRVETSAREVTFGEADAHSRRTASCSATTHSSSATRRSAGNTDARFSSCAGSCSTSKTCIDRRPK